MKWELVGCLALTWVLVIASLFKGNLFKFCFKNLEFIITRCLKSWKGLICDNISSLLCANSFPGLHGSKRCRLRKPHRVILLLFHLQCTMALSQSQELFFAYLLSILLGVKKTPVYEVISFSLTGVFWGTLRM